MTPAMGLRLGTLRRRLFVLLAVTSIVTVVGVNLVWLPGTLHDVSSARSELQLVAVRGVRDQIELFLADKEDALTAAARQFRAALLGGDPGRLAVVGQRFLQRERAFEEIGVFDIRAGWRHRLSRRDVMTPESIVARPSIDLTTTTGADVIWGPVVTTDTSEPWVTLATPLSSPAGGTFAVGVLNLKVLWSLTSEVQVGQGGRAYIVDSRGGLIAADDASLVLKQLSFADRRFVKHLLGGGRPNGVSGFYENERGIDAMATGLRLDRVGWGVVVEHPRAVVAQAIERKLLFFAVLTIAGILVSAVVGRVLSGRLTQPLERLRRGVQRFGRGELDHRVPIETSDEIGELAQQFNQMATELGASHARLEERIREATRDLERRKHEAEELARVARTLTDDLDVAQLADRVVQTVLGLFGVQSAVLWSRGPDGSLVALAISGQARRGFQRGDVLPVGVSMAGRAVSLGRAVWTRDVYAEPGLIQSPEQRARLRVTGDQAILCVPLAVKGQIIGVLSLGDGSTRDFTTEEVTLLQTFADQAAIVLQNANLYVESQTQRLQLTQILESTSDGVLFVGAGRRVQAANHHTGELLGCESIQLVGADLGVVLGHECTDASAAELIRTCDAGLAAGFAADGRGAAGDLELANLKRVLHWETRTTRDAADRTVGLTITLHDVTQEREIAQLKSDFVSFATHQLRTPLSGIKWMLELGVQEQEVGEQAKSYMVDALGAAQRLIQLVNDLLDVSRLESGRMKSPVQAVDLVGLTRTVLGDLKPQIDDKDHRVTVDAPEDIPEVFADPQLLRQIVLNLSSNAMKYSRPGGRIAVRLTRDREFVRWQIQDNGIGIPKESQRHLFEKFYRADNVVSLETDGTGLGLYLVRLIVEQMGGRVWCESEEGQGATFFFTAPCGQGDSRPGTPADPAPTA